MIYIGTSGYSYDDWRGPFYPEKMDKREMLQYYSRFFQSVEINSTYYTLPNAFMSDALAKKTPPEFKFSVKTYKTITHSDVADKDDAAAFVQALRPLRDTGKLGCILAQYPRSFKNNDENKDRIKQLRDLMDDIPTVVEFRNSEWVSQETFDLLRSIGLGYCAVDEPRLKGLMPPIAEATSEIGYIRFHGRNANDWWKPSEPWQRYNYLYSEDELREWIPKIIEINGYAKDTYVFFNNHYGGKSAVNAGMLAKIINVRLPFAEGEIPKKKTTLFDE